MSATKADWIACGACNRGGHGNDKDDMLFRALQIHEAKKRGLKAFDVERLLVKRRVTK